MKKGRVLFVPFGNRTCLIQAVITEKTMPPPPLLLSRNRWGNYWESHKTLANILNLLYIINNKAFHASASASAPGKAYFFGSS